MKASVSFALAGLLALTVATPLARQLRPVFRSEANYVEVTARVVDKDGKFVEGLTAKDFEIREDHRPQSVEQVFRVDLPTPWSKSTSVAEPIYRPGLPLDLQVAGGRIYLLYLNSVESQYIPVTRKLAKDFVNSFLMPDDVVAVWSTYGMVTFTNDKALLAKKLDEFLGTDDTLTNPVKGTGDAGRIHPSLTSALDWFSGVQGRKKSVLMFSAGWAGIGPVISNQTVPSPNTTYLVDRPDVQIYAVDTRGLVATAYKSTAGAAAAAAAGSVTTQSEDFFSSLTNMKWLAEDTGGFAILNHNTYQDGFKRIVDENSNYYVLGYQSTARKSPNWDFREISVKVKKPGLSGARIQARKGYIAR